ncbi:MAG: DsbA family oxidoreductase [Trueperaceae bacterium]
MRIDIFADIACPWCYVGDARLERVLSETKTPAEIIWHPFQLQPDLPLTGANWETFSLQKFGGAANRQRAFDSVAHAAQEDGITFRFENIASAANTRDAHRLILLAQERGNGLELANIFFKAYFTDGANLNDSATLAALAALAGISESETAALLASDTHITEVAQSQRLASQLGVSGVPFYIFNKTQGLSGAQPLEVFQQVVHELQAQRAVT